MGKGTDQVEFAQRFGRRYTTPSAEIELSNEHPLALQLADAMDAISANNADSLLAAMSAKQAASELRRQHAEIQRLHEERFREAAEQQLEIQRLQNELAALLAQAPTNEQIRDVLLACGYKIKPGLDDLMPYVYEGARAVLALQCANGITQPAKGDSA